MAGYVSMDDILKGVTSTPDSSKSDSGSGYVSMDSILSNQNQSNPAPAPAQSPTDYNNARGAAEADEQWQIGQGQKDMFSAPQPTPTPSEPSFLDKLGQALDPSKAWEGIKSLMSGNMFKNDTAEPQQSMYANDPSRQLPVIGPILRGVDAFGQDPLVQKIGELGREFYVPGASAENIASLAGSAENAVSRLFPSLGGSTAGSIAQKAATEALVGAPLGAGQTLQTNPNASLGDVATGAAQGALLGGVLGGGIPALSSLGERTMGGLAGFPARGEASIPETSTLPAEPTSGYKSMDEIFLFLILLVRCLHLFPKHQKNPLILMS
jgi:hypothetical protein